VTVARGMSGKFSPKFKTTPTYNWDDKALTITVTFTSIEEAGRAVEFIKSSARVMWPEIVFRGDPEWVEEDNGETA